MGYLFQFPLSSRCTLCHYMGNMHFGIPFQITPIKSVHSFALYGEQAFGIPFQITPIKRMYSLAFISGTSIWDAFFNSPYQEGVLWHFEIPFSNSLYQESVLSGIHMRNKHFGIPFSIPPIKRVYSLALI